MASWTSGVERGKRLAQAVGFAGELVKALLNLFTQTVDHVGSMWFAVPGGGAIVHVAARRAAVPSSV